VSQGTTGADCPTGDVCPALERVAAQLLSNDERVFLLEEALLLTFQRFGLPTDPDQQAAWDFELDATYRGFLAARCSAPPASFLSRARVMTAYRRALRANIEAA